MLRLQVLRRLLRKLLEAFRGKLPGTHYKAAKML
jgi:hypothetical protein